MGDMPSDLVRVLRDPTITINRDHEIRLADGRTLFEHLEEWRNAPSNRANRGDGMSDQCDFCSAAGFRCHRAKGHDAGHKAYPSDWDLPADLADVLRDQSIIVPQDADVFRRIAEWQDGPSGSAAGGES